MDGVRLLDGGAVTNETGGTLSGGVSMAGGAGVVTNAGVISGIVSIGDGGAVTNETGGTLVSGIYLSGGAGAVTNAGVISGTVFFNGSGANTLTLETGSILDGEAFGSTAAGATSTLFLEGKGTASNEFDDFNTMDVKAGGYWTLSGDATVGATVVYRATLIVTGDLASRSLTLEGGGAAVQFDTVFQGDITFQGADSLTLATTYGKTIDGFGLDDTIDLTSLKFDSSASSYSLTGGSGTDDEIVTIHEGAASYTLQFEQTPDLTRGELKLMADANGDTKIGFVSTSSLPPVLSGGGNKVFYFANGSPSEIDAGLGVVDPSHADLTGASVEISSGFLAGDQLGFVTQNGIVGSYDASTGVLTLSGSASIAAYQGALETIVYSSTAADPTDGNTDDSRTVVWTVTDGTTTSAPLTSTIDLAVPGIKLHPGGVEDNTGTSLANTTGSRFMAARAR